MRATLPQTQASLADWFLIKRARLTHAALANAITAYQLVAELPAEALDLEALAHLENTKRALEKLLGILTPSDPGPLTGRS